MASERYSLLALQDLIAVTNQTLSALRNKIAAADQTIEDDATISDLHRDPRVIGMCRWELRVALALSEDLVNHMREAETWIRYSQRGHAGSDAPADGLLRQQRMEERWVPCPDCHMRFDPHLWRSGTYSRFGGRGGPN